MIDLAQRSEPREGHVEVICGPMFSGKTEELIRRLRRAQIARLRVVVFKPRIDTRYDPVEIVSHSSLRLKSIPIESANEIADLLARERAPVHVVGIDEAQFFDDSIADVVSALAARGVRVVVAGLDLDYLGRPFGPMPRLLCSAELVTKQLAVCIVCGGAASRSQRVHPEAARLSVRNARDEETMRQVVIGGGDFYEARCRRCFFQGIDTPTQHAGLDR